MSFRVHRLRGGTRGPLSVLWGGVVVAVAIVLAFPLVAGATTIKADQAYAKAQLLKLSNFPSGWQQEGKVEVTTSDSDTYSMLNATQMPDLYTCMGKQQPLSVVAAEANSPFFGSANLTTQVLDIADVYQNANEAKADFPPFNNPKFANCFLQVEGQTITDYEKNAFQTGTTFGTPTASVVKAPKYGNQSGMVAVKVPVTLTSGTTGSDFFTILVIRQGRSTAELEVDQVGTTPSVTLINKMAKTVTAKMKAKPPRTH